MTDYRNPNDPFYRDDQINRDASSDIGARGSNATWGWIAGALFLVVILAIAFGIGREPTMTASNDTSPAITRMAPSVNPSPTAPAPAPVKPAIPAPTGQ